MNRICTKVSAAVLAAAVMLCGCGALTISHRKVRELEYTVTEEEALPDKLAEQIEAQKEEPFHLTYEDGEYLYIASGYGKKDTGGYSIRVEELYLSENAVCCETSLCGPTQEEQKLPGASYPYIVLKTEARKEPVVFE